MEGCYKFILEILMLRIEPRKCFKSYTYIHFFREHSSVFYLRFSIFHSNQTDEISNIYNYPRGRGATQTIILRTVNCNNRNPEINKIFLKPLINQKKYSILFKVNLLLSFLSKAPRLKAQLKE